MTLQLVSIQRNTQFETRYHPRMGHLITRVTRIQKAILGLPVKTLHKYRETYYGEIKDCQDCVVDRMDPPAV